jgi:hypothetical protein
MSFAIELSHQSLPLAVMSSAIELCLSSAAMS